MTLVTERAGEHYHPVGAQTWPNCGGGKYAAIPRIIGFAVVLIVGWVISSLLARGVEALLRAVRFNDLARRSGFADFVHKMGVKDDASGLIASIAKWFVRFLWRRALPSGSAAGVEPPSCAHSGAVLQPCRELGKRLLDRAFPGRPETGGTPGHAGPASRERLERLALPRTGTRFRTGGA